MRDKFAQVGSFLMISAFAGALGILAASCQRALRLPRAVWGGGLGWGGLSGVAGSRKVVINNRVEG